MCHTQVGIAQKKLAVKGLPCPVSSAAAALCACSGPLWVKQQAAASGRERQVAIDEQRQVVKAKVSTEHKNLHNSLKYYPIFEIQKAIWLEIQPAIQIDHLNLSELH